MLAHKTVQQHHYDVPQVLIKWHHRPRDEATWEDFTTIKSQFLKYQLKDKLVIIRGGNVRDMGSRHQRKSVEGLFEKKKGR